MLRFVTRIYLWSLEPHSFAPLACHSFKYKQSISRVLLLQLMQRENVKNSISLTNVRNEDEVAFDTLKSHRCFVFSLSFGKQLHPHCIIKIYAVFLHLLSKKIHRFFVYSYSTSIALVSNYFVSSPWVDITLL